MWVATHDDAAGGAVRVRQDGSMQSFAVPLLPSSRITAILATKDNSTWFASRRGVARLNSDGQWKIYNTVNSGLAWNHVLALAQDGQERIWFATGRGVSVLTECELPKSGGGGVGR